VLFAHKASDSYVTIKASADTLEGRWDIALRDLDYAISLDANNDGAITWGELRNQRELVNRYAFEHLKISVNNGSTCQITPTNYLVDEHSDGAYSVLLFSAACPSIAKSLLFDYTLFFDLDPQHRGLLKVRYQQVAHTAILSPAQSRRRIELAIEKPVQAFLQYLHEGVWHIWTGYDHMLFLLSLLLPAVFVREARQWRTVERFRPVLLAIVKWVTAFTVAHSLTLSLAALNLMDFSSRWVESAIAASVLLAAVNNFYPLVSRNLWLVAFAFGLIHGLGFANVLKDLGLPEYGLIRSLLAFNLGVEIGQLIMVGGFLPLAFAIRQTVWYRVLCVKAGSGAIILMAIVWLLERSLNLKLIS